jgi:hypothetical protein
MIRKGSTMTDTETIDLAPEDAAWDDPAERLPRRPRRRLITPVTLALAAVAVGAGGFVGGVVVQRSQDSGATAAGGPPAGFARPGGFGGGGGGAQDAGFITGQVDTLDGRNLYVKTADGTTVRVKVTATASVTRTAKSKVRAVHPGDTVVVTGEPAADGTVKAAQVTASAAGVASGGRPGAAP